MRSDRERQADALDDIGVLPDTQLDGALGVLLKTFAEASYPTVAQSVFACRPVVVDADDTEGAAPLFEADTTRTVYAINLGTAVPGNGTYLIGVATGGRITFRYDG